MNTIFLPFLGYLVLLVIAILIAWICTGCKRKIIRKRFGLGGKDIAGIDPHLKKFVLLDWCLAFAFAGVMLFPAIISGNSIWPETLAIEIISIFFGILVVKVLNITDWYMECFLVNPKSYWSSLVLTLVAILVGNWAYTVNLQPNGIVAWSLSVLLMILSLIMLINPIFKEWIFYSEAGLKDWIEFIRGEPVLGEPPSTQKY